jgi:hypothetical protein
MYADVLFVIGIKFRQGTWLCAVVNIRVRDKNIIQQGNWPTRAAIPD